MEKFLLALSILLAFKISSLHGLNGQPKPTLEQFHTSPGIYYERQRGVRISDTDWRMVVYLDIDFFYRQPFIMKDEILKIYENYMSANFTNYYLNQTIFNLNMKVDQVSVEIQALNQTIKDLKLIPTVAEFENNPRMIKRFVPFGFVGKASNYLFGTATTDDIAILHEAIDDLQNSKHTFTHLLGRQTHVVQSALQNMHTAIKYQGDQLSSIREKLEQKITNHEKLLNFMYAVDSWVLFFQKRAEYVARSCKELRDAIFEARKGHLMPNLLTKEQLIELPRSIHHDTIHHEFPVSEDDITPELIADLAKTSICFSQGYNGSLQGRGRSGGRCLSVRRGWMERASARRAHWRLRKLEHIRCGRWPSS